MKHLLVNVSAVADGHHQHEQLTVFDLAENPIIADPITLQPGQVCFESLAEPAGVSVTGNPFIKEGEDVALGLVSELLEFF